jgi:hypothetical protein
MIILAALLLPPAAPAQEARQTGATTTAEGTQLRVRVELLRYRDERLLTRQPYTFLVSELKPTRVRMSVRMPVVTSSAGSASEDSKLVPTTSFTYQDVGTSLDCSARALSNGKYQLSLAVEGSSVYTLGLPMPESPGAEFRSPEGRPLFRTFSVQLDPILRAGETTEMIAATDPATGEMLKIELELDIVK